MLFSDVLYMLVRYTSPGGPMCLRCLMLTLSGPVEFLFCFLPRLRLPFSSHSFFPRLILPSFSIVVFSLCFHPSSLIHLYTCIEYIFQAMPNIDYGVKDKRVLESIMGVEFGNSSIGGVMYNGEYTGILYYILS